MPRTPRPNNKHGGEIETDGTIDDNGGGNSSGNEVPSSQKQQSQSKKNYYQFPSITDPQIPYNLPQWLVSEKQTPRSFSLPLPDVPAKIKQSVQSHLLAHQNYSQKFPGKDSGWMLHNLKVSRQEEKQAANKVKVAKDKLAQALLLKSEKLKVIRKAHEAEKKVALEDLERTMREEQQIEDQKLKRQIKEGCKLECQKKFQEVMKKKRKREQEEDERERKKEAVEAAKTKEDANSDGVDGTETIDSNIEDLKLKRKELDVKVEKLSEMKRDMFWLLKQVIRQEATRKMKKKKLEATAKDVN